MCVYVGILLHVTPGTASTVRMYGVETVVAFDRRRDPLLVRSADRCALLMGQPSAQLPGAPWSCVLLQGMAASVILWLK